MGRDAPVTPRRRLGRFVATVSAVVLLASCALGSSSGAVDDETLFQQIEDLDGVASTEDLRFVSDMTRGQRYAGEIVLDDSLTEDEAACVSRQLYELFWQGRRASDSSVVVVHGDTRGTMVAASGLEDLYGPRPTEPRASATISPCSETDPG
ncbi:hypothetical protein [Cellulomonas fimi]|uniref:Lipoprotein n=1 Tax=Cellulomonas fimi (strain ATCC 484 / DSM 20113 / JCM 1341 / CCUG 24087 / LMG 16345 / NBRC 15513 / NCIMB 8980 / NCTC 7547 / NRS-133) TaxID=590998 RepID=F4H0I7_CELFA|nr:hypothetical protein [Cellulomonas fimi]AEE47356.1 hypothetical protein Celf_3242 [Cellulomonas fimi ATCC 484]NNH05814.1 hypothetical protein [Cellulomonas fimi]VEH36015.1 Uncharacterised protein [Cellulomonas fimi]